MGQSNFWYYPDMNAPTASIPTYGLFGESHAPNPAGFAHIETIAERSSLHDWEIAPHRHERGIQVLIVSAGHAQVTVDGASFALEPPAFVVLPAGSVHGFRFSPATHGHVLTLSQDFAGRARGGEDPLQRLLSEGGHAPLPQTTAERITFLAGEMLGLAQAWQAGDLLFLALAEALLRSLCGLEMADAPQGEDRRLARLRHLIEVHLREHRPLSFYAQSLGCTERTLTRLCRARLGISPLDLLHRRIGLEAQRLLRYTNATVAQISQELGFADPSYFSRFYLRVMGHRPQIERLGN
jgi:AraC family transcriptional activator of pobA